MQYLIQYELRATRLDKLHRPNDWVASSSHIIYSVLILWPQLNFSCVLSPCTYWVSLRLHYHYHHPVSPHWVFSSHHLYHPVLCSGSPLSFTNFIIRLYLLSSTLQGEKIIRVQQWMTDCIDPPHCRAYQSFPQVVLLFFVLSGFTFNLHNFIIIVRT